MSRVTPAEVKAIVPTTLSDTITQVWIDSANAIVTDNSTCISKDEAGLTQVELYFCRYVRSNRQRLDYKRRLAWL